MNQLELCQFSSRNAFRPIVIMNWNNSGLTTEVNSYLRLDYRITFMSFILFLFWILLSVKQHTLVPMLATFFLTIVLFIFFNIFE